MKTTLAIIALVLLSQTGCAVIAVSAGGSAAVVQAAQVLDAAKLGADIVSGATTGKTLTDHAISYITDQDCSMFNLAEGESICSDYPVASEEPEPTQDVNNEQTTNE